MLRFISLALACIQNMTMGGVIYGWGSISALDGLLHKSPALGGAGLTQDNIHAMFVLSTVFSFFGPFSFGLLLDLQGPRVCSLAATLCIIFGCLIFGFSNIDKLPFFIPGMCLIAFGGSGVQSAIMHVSNLFPESKGLVTAIITGSFQVSFFVFYIFDRLWVDLRFNYTQLFVGYAVCVCLSNFVVSAIYWSDKQYGDISFQESYSSLIGHLDRIGSIEINQSSTELTATSNNGYQIPSNSSVNGAGSGASELTQPLEKPHSVDQKQSLPLQQQTKRSARGAKSPAIYGRALKSIKMKLPDKDIKNGTLIDQLTSRPFVQLLLYFTVASFWANFYMGTVDLQLGDTLKIHGRERADCSQFFTMTNAFGIILYPFAGAMVDAFGLPVTSFCTGICGLVWASSLLLGSQHLITFSFIFYSAFRMFLFTLFFAQLIDALGFKYFGVISGLIFIVSGIAGLLQFPLASWSLGNCHKDSLRDSECQSGRWAATNTLLCFSFVGLLIYSYMDLRFKRRIELIEASLVRSISSSAKLSSNKSLIRTNSGRILFGSDMRFEGGEDEAERQPFLLPPGAAGITASDEEPIPVRAGGVGGYSIFAPANSGRASTERPRDDDIADSRDNAYFYGTV